MADGAAASGSRRKGPLHRITDEKMSNIGDSWQAGSFYSPKAPFTRKPVWRLRLRTAINNDDRRPESGRRMYLLLQRTYRTYFQLHRQVN
jgi:hypothetical protein